ncbi:CIC11C00000001898 [Sungouiella intermedia]|uniref:CIC11C00000001898 n=1 Tax=Sungouiella intermedia TaxID=45354 RepID=A0A1L0B7B6_9ASCO|nr:CIC11C00000001898 [[Candida] intermedia]
MSDNPPDAAGSRSRKPKNLYIAHRRSPSELTTLMVEQYNLQRQLEAVQSQQKQILQQQAQLLLQESQLYKSHSRSPSYNGQQGHRRTGSLGGNNNNHGHSRRHSLGLNEAIKAAALQRVSNLASLSGSTSQNTQNDRSPGLDTALPTLGPMADNLGGFRFPNNNADSDRELSPNHNRSRSLAYGQQSFKFPPDNSSLLPPVPNFGNQSPERGHQRRSSHYRSGSRNFDSGSNINSNWRTQQSNHQRNSLNSNTLEPPNFFVPGHKNKSSSFGGGNSSISSMNLFNPNNNNNNGVNNVNGRKSLFAPYLPQSSLPELINEGRLVTGILRVNKKNRSDAYVSTDGLLEADIFICGSKDRNRALEGDLVAVELLVVDEVWDSKKEKEEKKRRKDNTLGKSNTSSILNDDIHNDATSTLTNDNDGKLEAEGEGLGRRGSLKQRPTMKKNDDVEVEGQALLLVEEEEINDEVKPLYAGHVVAVVDRIPGQIFAGTLGLLRPAQAAQAAIDKKSGKESSVHTPKAPKIVWFKPTDKRVPLIAIPTEQAPRDFVDKHEKYADQLFIASIKRWPITSLHPFGTLVTKLGPIDDPNIEVDSILRDNNFLCDEYPANPDADDTYLASFFGPIPNVAVELQSPNRIEYISDYVIAFTANKQFSEVALHVKRLSNTIIELGFHSVDVSHYVQQSSTLERKAKKRSSSVFLPQKVSHLYPVELNDEASFEENMKSLAISVVFEIDTTNFEVEDVHIHESVVIPKSLVTFDEVDDILNNNPPESITSATSDYIKTFALIAKEFRRQRLEDRSLSLSPSLTLLDQLDDEKVRLHLNIFDSTPAALVVAEISHKVNATVASKIHAKLGDEAFLRRQALPTLQKLEGFSRKAANLGVRIDTSTAASLEKSILSIQDPVKRQCIETLLYKCLPRPKYYIAGKQDPDNYSHYYLNLPLYTHFTAPLRRFSDLIVHRQVKAVIYDRPAETPTDLDALKAIADYCNFKKDCAANAQEQAIHLLLSQTINEMSEHAGQLLVMGTVVQVYESSFDVFIPEFGIEKRVHGDQLPLVKAEFDKTNRILELYWEKGVDSATYIPPDERSSLSYRSSIKNKYRTSASEAAKIQSKNMAQKETIATESILSKLAELDINAPKVVAPVAKMWPSVRPGILQGLAPYLQDAITRVEGNSYIQEIREFKPVAVLLRAEIGMALPCLTVRILNPFADI